MLLLIALTLKGSIAIATPIPPTPTPTFIGGGISRSIYKTNEEIAKENENEELKNKRRKIIIEDSELAQIVQLTLRNFTI